MRIEVKIKGILAMADISLQELEELSGVSRQMLHKYLNVSHDIQASKKGAHVVSIVDKLQKLVMTEALPMSNAVQKYDRIATLRELLG